MTTLLTQTIFSFIITIIVYLFYPMLLIFSKSEMTKKSIKRTAILNGIICFVLFTCLREMMELEANTNIVPAVFWSYVAHRLLLKKCHEHTHITDNVSSDTAEETTLLNNENTDNNELNTTSFTANNSKESCISTTLSLQESLASEKDATTKHENIDLPPKSTENRKTRFCSKCGALVDYNTKKCSGCGKQYFKGIRTLIAPFIIILLLIALGILGSSYYSLQKRALYFEEEYHYYKDRYDDSKNNLKALEKDIQANSEKLQFINEHAVFIEVNGTNLYHTYECKKFKGEEFYILNTEWAKSEGYKPCPKCH